ncbi:MAG: hypothetical protein ABII96_02300 [Candidatus Zixiibacteriota bacterium]
MSIVKSFSVGDGDMFYINHNTDNFTVIDCCLSDENRGRIVKEIKALASTKGVVRYISSHPDDDHIRGLKHLDAELNILNFYCVRNEVTKPDKTEDFTRYCQLRDSVEKVFYLSRGCKRKWLNQSDEIRKSAGINIHWPDIEDDSFRSVLDLAKKGDSPNNISSIITYGVQDGVTLMWMGDLESDFMEVIKGKLTLPKAHILFAPHHGRETGKVPQALLDTIDPQIIIIGEAPSEQLDYYSGYNTITQNSAGDIIFECLDKNVNIFVSEKDYEVYYLDDEGISSTDNYLGTLNI